MAAARPSRKRVYIGVLAALLVVGAVAGFARLKGASADVDAAKVVTVETGTMVRSVVATGKIEPTTKVEIKSRANGIIEKLPVDVDSDVNAGDVLAELDKEQLQAALRSADANLQAARAALDAAEANLKKDIV
ncbi:MAG TPA: biotin/lipoyl-binding protein, partial [Vicinamibacterales bacterium]|nr:biotin/lipoyl-binding protein [Vicinamibacterales bacterium]